MSVDYPIIYNYFLGDSRFSAVIPERERRRTNTFVRKAFSVRVRHAGACPVS
jgi:hypothetical protein